MALRESAVRRKMVPSYTPFTSLSKMGSPASPRTSRRQYLPKHWGFQEFGSMLEDHDASSNPLPTFRCPQASKYS